MILLANLPLLRRLRTLLLANNRISAISPSLHLSAPNLTSLMLTNNNIAELGDLQPLQQVRSLRYLCLLANPVREKKWYREWLIYSVKSIRVLDFERIRDKVAPGILFLSKCLTFSRSAVMPKPCSSPPMGSQQHLQIRLQRYQHRLRK